MKIKMNIDKYIIILFFIVAFMCFLIFYRLPLHGFYFISRLGDIKEQYIHFFNLFHSLIRSGEWPFWSWEFGPGGSFWNQFSYYMLGDIFVWPLLLLPKNLFPYSFIPLTSLKIILMSLGMYVFLKKIGIRSPIAMVAGISYSFTILHFEYAYTHYFFVNPAVFFPFLLWGYEKYLSEKKILPFSIIFFFCAISNFYFLYMLTVGLFIYVILRFFTQDYVERTIKGFWSFHWRLALLYLLSLGVSMVIFLPSVLGFIHSNAFFRPAKPQFDSVLTPGELIRKLLWSGGIHFIPLLTVPLLVINGKKKFLLGLMGLLISLMIMVQKVNSIIGGFSLPTEFRAFFVYNALFILLAALALNNIDFKKKRNIVGLGILSMIIFYWLFRNPFTHYGQFLMYLPLVFTIFFLLYKNIKIHFIKTISFSLSLLAVCLYAFAIPYSFVSDTIIKSNGEDPGNFNKGAGGTLPLMTKSEYDKFYQNKEVKTVLTSLEEDTSLYRIYLNDPGITTHNSSMSYGYRSFYAYNSLLQWNLQKFEMDDLGQLGSRSLSMLRGYPNSTIMNTLLGNKYTVTFNGKGFNLYGYETIMKNGDTVIQRNKHWLPIGFLYDHAMSVKEYKTKGFENQEELMLKNAVIPDKVKKQYQIPSETKLSGTPLATIKDLEIENADTVQQTDKGILVQSSKKAILLTLPIKAHALGEMSVFSDITPLTSNKGINIDISNNLGTVYYLEKNMVENQYITTQYHYQNTTNKVLFRFGKDKGSEWVKLVLQPGKFLIKDVNAFLANYHTYEQWTDKYKENSLKNIKFSNNQISGTVQAKKGSILFLSIPYSKGWKAYVDNKNVDVFPTQMAYSGIYVSEGSHTIKLTYTPEGLKVGFIISLGSLLLIIGLRRKGIFNFKKMYV